MKIVENYGNRYNMDDVADVMELIYDANFGVDNNIDEIIKGIDGLIIERA